MNARGGELLGFDIEKMRNTEFLISRLHPEDHKYTLNSILDVNYDNAIWFNEFRLLNKNDEVIWVRGQSIASSDEEGNIIHNGVLLDITEQKEAENALILSQKRFKNIADNLPGMVIKYKLNTDGSDELLYASHGIKDLYEIDSQTALANNNLLWKRVHKDDKASYAESIKKSAENLSTWKFEHRLRFPDGRIKWIDMRGIPEKQDDGSIIWDSIGLDITKRKRAENDLKEINESLEQRVEERTQKAIKLSKQLERYWLAAEHAKTGVFEYHIHDEILEWDSIMYELYGVDKGKFNSNLEEWKSCLHPEDYDASVTALNKSIENQVDFDTIFRIIRKDNGEIRHIRAKAKAEVNENGETVSIYGTNYDVTREMQLADEKELALKELKEAQITLVQSEKMASLGVLTAGIAHELNNPLNYIIGGISALQNHLKDDDQINKDEINEYVSWIKTGGERATKIVRSLNLFSGSNEKKREVCDLHRTIEDCLVMIENRLTDKINVIKDFSDKPAEVSANYSTLHQVILNIITNSIDAINDNAEIRFTTTVKKNKIILSISDTGSGIPEDKIDKVLDPFYTTKPPG